MVADNDSPEQIGVRQVHLVAVVAIKASKMDCVGCGYESQLNLTNPASSVSLTIKSTVVTVTGCSLSVWDLEAGSRNKGQRSLQFVLECTGHAVDFGSMQASRLS